MLKFPSEGTHFLSIGVSVKPENKVLIIFSKKHIIPYAVVAGPQIHPSSLNFLEFLLSEFDRIWTGPLFKNKHPFLTFMHPFCTEINLWMPKVEVLFIYC